MVNKFEHTLLTRFGRIHERDGQTDTAWRQATLVHSITRQKLALIRTRSLVTLSDSRGRNFHGDYGRFSLFLWTERSVRWWLDERSAECIMQLEKYRQQDWIGSSKTEFGSQRSWYAKMLLTSIAPRY